jgi:hypothetical protein
MAGVDGVMMGVMGVMGVMGGRLRMQRSVMDAHRSDAQGTAPQPVGKRKRT